LVEASFEDASPEEMSFEDASLSLFETMCSGRFVLSQPQDSFSAEQVPSMDVSSTDTSLSQFTKLQKKRTNVIATASKIFMLPENGTKFEFSFGVC
jgi:hypothetical protein